MSRLGGGFQMNEAGGEVVADQEATENETETETDSGENRQSLGERGLQRVKKSE
jgi:hypothetical protein